MSDLEKWLDSNRGIIARAGFSIENRGDDEAKTVIAESESVVFQLTEWPGKVLEFHAISFAEDRVISVAEAPNHLTTGEKCDYYLRQVQAYMNDHA